MNINEMQYDFKLKFNKLDSQQNRNFLVPEIDWVLREAEELFIKMTAFPRNYSGLGFERTQRSIDDIRVLIEDEFVIPVGNALLLPVGYWHFLRGKVFATRGSCTDVALKLHIQQHDDDFENNPFVSTSFDWREANGLFAKEVIKLEPESGVLFTGGEITFLRRPSYMHNAEKHRGGTYNDLRGNVLTGHTDCELPEHTHREIVDIAVLIASGAIQSSSYQVHKEKLGFNLN